MEEQQELIDDGQGHTDFEDGFSIEDETEGQDSEQQPEPQQDVGNGGEEQPQQEPPLFVEQQQPQYAPQANQQLVQQEKEEPKRVEIPDELKDEFERLRQGNPQAAKLAEEDTPEGRSVRDRLANYGAEIANDRAEQLMDMRQRAAEKQQAQRQQVENFNRHYWGEIAKAHPDYVRMMFDPNRRAEYTRYLEEVRAWIGTKSYAEGSQLAAIASRSRDPGQVSDLLTRFESERKAVGRQKRPDPTGAFAVPGRGATVAPTGFGDKDSFDDGWALNESKDR